MLWKDKWFPGTNLQDLNLDWILKKISSLRGGSTGQVLSKKSGTDFDFEWVTGGAGGDISRGEFTALQDLVYDLDAELAKIDYAKATPVTARNENLNTYVDGGVWYFTSASSPLNKPDIPGGGFLVVLRGGGNTRLAQIWINNNAANPGTLWRTNSSSPVNFTAWQEIATDNTTIMRGIVKKNSQNLTAEFLAVAESYYTNRASLRYGNNTFLDAEVINNSIDCSAFVGLCMRGLSFDETPLSPNWTEGAKSPLYWTENTKFSWSWNPYNYTVLSGATSYNNLCRKASQFGKLMLEQGQRIIVDEKFANIEPGDIVFYSKKADGEWVEPSKFMHISHVAICCDKTNTSINNYPYTHTMIEAAGRNTNAIGKFTLENDVNTEFISLVCRPDLGSLVDKLQEVPVTVVDSLPAGVTSVKGLSVYKKDDMVQVLMSITRDSTDMNTFGIIATGLPIPALEGNIVTTGGTISLPFAEINPRTENATGVTLRVRVDQNGRLRVAKGTIPDDYNGGFLYLAKN